MYNFGNDNLQWNDDAWNNIKQEVLDEIKAGIAAQIFPLSEVESTTTFVPAGIINLQTGSVDEGKSVSLIDISADFQLTEQQASGEENVSTVESLAISFAKLVRQAIDGFIFQGPNIATNPLFHKVRFRNGSGTIGLLDATEQYVTVKPATPHAKKYGEHTYDAVAKAASILAKNGYENSNVLVLDTDQYADANTLPSGTLITPLARLKELATEGVYQSAMVSPVDAAPSRGFLMSKGKSTVELVVGSAGKTEITQLNTGGELILRIFWRGIHRVHDPRSIVRLEFEQ